MNDFTNLIDWSRAQFALTAIYHYLFVPLTLGLSFIIAIMETKYVISGDSFYKKTVKFWMRLFAVSFIMSAATGVVLEFELGTNWSNYSQMVGDIFAAPLVMVGILTLFVECTFMMLMYMGWGKVNKIVHLTATWLNAIAASLSAFWILVANAWMHFPTGLVLNPLTSRFELVHLTDIISFVATTKFSHTLTSAFVLSAIFVIGVSAWYILNKKGGRFTKYSIKVATWFGLAGTLAVFVTGHLSAQIIARIQPLKLAAIENLYHGHKNVPFTIVPGLEIPNAFSFMAYGDGDAYVPGIDNINKGCKINNNGEKIEILGFDIRNNVGNLSLGDFSQCHYELHNLKVQKAIYRANSVKDPDYFLKMGQYMGYSYFNKAEETVPPIWPIYWSFRFMVVFGICLFIVILVWMYHTYKKSQKIPAWWLKFSVFSIFMAYVASESGWIVSEVGRQPWIIQNLLPVKVAVSKLPYMSVAVTFWIFAILFIVFLIAAISIITKQIKKGPEVE